MERLAVAAIAGGRGHAPYAGVAHRDTRSVAGPYDLGHVLVVGVLETPPFVVGRVEVVIELGRVEVLCSGPKHSLAQGRLARSVRDRDHIGGVGVRAVVRGGESLGIVHLDHVAAVPVRDHRVRLERVGEVRVVVGFVGDRRDVP